MVKDNDERILVLFDERDDLLEPDVGISRRLERNALVVSEPRQLVELIALHRADYEPTTLCLVADALNLLVLVRKRRRQDDLRARAASGRERLLDGIASVNPLAAGHHLPRSLMMSRVLIVTHD